MPSLEEIKEIVSELNNEIFDINEETYHNFSFTSSTYIDIISFNDTVLWDSENDDRIYDDKTDKKEPLKDYIKRQYNNYVDELMKFYFIN